MRRLTVFVGTAVMVLCMTAGALGQTRPDFSGRWTMDPASAPAPPGGAGRGGGRGGGAGFGPEFTAKQDASTLTISRMQGDQAITATYRLDGSESRNSVPGRQGGAPTEQVSKASWEGNSLVIVTTLNFAGNSVEQRRVLSLEGGNLVIEQTTPGLQGGGPTTQKLVYKKS